MRPKELALCARTACEDKKGHELVILDIRRINSLIDYYVIGSGTSDRHVRALAENVMDELEKHKVRCHHVEGLRDSRWVLLDYGDVMVHLFHPETRGFYNLERLWGEAKILQ